MKEQKEKEQKDKQKEHSSDAKGLLGFERYRWSWRLFTIFTSTANFSTQISFFSSKQAWCFWDQTEFLPNRNETSVQIRLETLQNG